MITKLTAAQENRLTEYRDRWLAIGLSTEPADRPACEAAIRQMYAGANLEPPRIVWCGSPLSQMLTCARVRHKASVGARVWASVAARVWDRVRDSVGASVWDRVRARVWDSVRDSVWDSVGASVWDSVGASVWDRGYGQHDASWLGFCAYFREVCGLVSQTDMMQGLFAQAQTGGWYLPYRDLCLVAERTSQVRLDERRQVHNPAGPAIAYPDGWEIYALHGVRVPAWLVTTPAERLDAREIVKLENAEQRREAVRKIGVERLIQQLGAKRLDQVGDYALLLLDIGDGRRRPYLKMRNPSLGVWHVEGIHPNCRTVEEAITWRNDSETMPVQLT